MVMQRQPGDMLLTGQISGQQAGNGIFQLLPSLPHESPIPMPRVLAKALFPQGFQPFRVAAPVAPAPVVVAQPIQPPAPAVNQVPPAPPRAAPPAPPKLQDRSLDPEMRTARSIRQVVKERRGFL